MSHLARSFEPLARRDARVLVLGSMPGQASLQAAQYYAHPRNAFWPIMEALFGVDAAASYGLRTRGLRGAGVALWDVLAECQRPGSLDSAIEPGSVVANDIADFLLRHRQVRGIFFNGAAAQTLFRRHTLPAVERSVLARRELVTAQLPSTSPAHAAMDFTAKLERWREVARVCQS